MYFLFIFHQSMGEVWYFNVFFIIIISPIVCSSSLLCKQKKHVFAFKLFYYRKSIVLSLCQWGSSSAAGQGVLCEWNSPVGWPSGHFHRVSGAASSQRCSRSGQFILRVEFFCSLTFWSFSLCCEPICKQVNIDLTRLINFQYMLFTN